jgi:hypothetical protein
MKGNKELSTIIMGKTWEAAFFFFTENLSQIDASNQHTTICIQ